MLRYDTINILGGVEQVHCIDTPQIVGSYVVDDSAFVPLKEAVKNVNAGSITPQMARTLYDFPNGKDDGSKVPVDRTHGFTGDIAEVSVVARESAKAVKDDFTEYLKDKELNDRLNAISSGSTSDNASEQ